MNELIHRRILLALQSDIPDMLSYAEEWNKLGAEFDAIGATANAAICWSNWKRYKTMGEDGYTRFWDKNILTLMAT